MGYNDYIVCSRLLASKHHDLAGVVLSLLCSPGTAVMVSWPQPCSGLQSCDTIHKRLLLLLHAWRQVPLSTLVPAGSTCPL